MKVSSEVIKRAKKNKINCPHITGLKGGRGAVRELIDFVLKKQNKWDDITRRYYREDGEGLE